MFNIMDPEVFDTLLKDNDKYNSVLTELFETNTYERTQWREAVDYWVCQLKKTHYEVAKIFLEIMNKGKEKIKFIFDDLETAEMNYKIWKIEEYLEKK